MRHLAKASVLALAFAATACYHAVIDTGRPASGTVVTRPWQPSFIVGLVPPPPLNVATQCPNGVARVETVHSFLEGLVAALTFSIFTPMTYQVTCASGGTASIPAGAATVDVATAATTEQRAAAMSRAGSLAAESGQAVFVKF